MVPRVSIILLNWNSWEDTIECLESLWEIDYENYEVIIVDNNSSDDSIERIRDYCNGNIETDPKFSSYNPTNKPIALAERTNDEINKSAEDFTADEGVHLIKNDKNYGFPEGNNIAFRFALQRDTDYLLMLNNDTVVDKSFLSSLVETAKSRQKAGIVGSLIYDYDTPHRIQSAGGELQWWLGGYTKHYGKDQIDDGQFEEVTERDYVWGTSQLISRRTIDEVGYLDPYFFFGIEEYDYCARVKENGLSVFLDPDSKVYHKKGSSSDKLDSNPNIQEKIAKQQGPLMYKYYLRFCRKHYPPYLFIIPFLVRVSIQGLVFIYSEIFNR